MSAPWRGGQRDSRGRPETGGGGARTPGMPPHPPPDADPPPLRAQGLHPRGVNQELLATVADLRAMVERQQAHIDKLVRRAFGRRSERIAGPSLFDGTPDPDAPTDTGDAPASSAPPPVPGTPRRRGHGRRPR